MPVSSTWIPKDISDALSAVKYAVVEALGVYYDARTVTIWDLDAINRFGARFSNLWHYAQAARPLLKALANEFIGVRNANRWPEPTIASLSDAWALGLASTFADETINRCCERYSNPDGQWGSRIRFFSLNNQQVDPEIVGLLEKVKIQLSEVAVGDITQCREELFRLMEEEARLVTLARINIPASTPTHNADFTMVNWFGTEYTFAHGVQAAAVKVLWKEWEDTGLGLNQQTIGNAVDSERDSFRMANAFRNHPAMGTMIQTDGRGIYRLVRSNVFNENNAESTQNQR